MKWIIMCSLFILVSCQDNAAPGADNSDTTSATNSVYKDQIPATENLIVPGSSVGKISLGLPADSLENILGKPSTSNAAMGKAWMTWQGKRDEHNNATELNIFTTYKDDSMQEKTVQQIRTTSSTFTTEKDIHVYSSLEQITNEFPGVQKVATYNNDGRDISIYDDKDGGIAFEIAPANEQRICIGIIIHKEGEDVRDVLRTFRPELKNVK